MALATELIEQRSADTQLSSARIARAETKRRPLLSHRVWDVASHLCLTGVLMLLIGEAWTRLPGSPQAIQYLYDEELSYRYAPNQTPTSRLLSLYGIDSPPMHIDERGFRNSAADWSNLTLLALGSSEVLGPGVAEEHLWTSRLSELLSQSGGRKVQVYNAGTGGYGPYHSAVVFRRFLEQDLTPALAIVRVSLADSDFIQPTPEQLKTEKHRKDQRDLLKRYSRFLSFVFAKLKLQGESFKALPSYLVSRQSVRDPYSAQAGDAMWTANGEHWSRIASLAKERKIPVLFMIADPYGTEGGLTLFSAFQANLGNHPCVLVRRYTNELFGLNQPEVSERRKLYKERYMLPHDEHGNVLQHEVIASELYRYLRTDFHSGQKGGCQQSGAW